MKHNSMVNTVFRYLTNHKLNIIRIAVYAFFFTMLIILLYTSIALNNNIINRKTENDALHRNIESQKQLINSLENQLYKREQILINLNAVVLQQSDALEFIQKPNIKFIKLNNYRNKVMDQGKILLDMPNKKALLLAKNLAKLSIDETYQLWAYVYTNPVSLGTFQADDRGNAILKVEYLPNPSNITRFAITNEPEGGSPKPSGEMHMLGSM